MTSSNYKSRLLDTLFYSTASLPPPPTYYLYSTHVMCAGIHHSSVIRSSSKNLLKKGAYSLFIRHSIGHLNPASLVQVG